MSSLNDLLGWLASSLVFATFCAREMLPLRVLAITSNIAFISYGYGGHLWPIVGLHAAMLPMNLLRLRQALLASKDDVGCRSRIRKKETTHVRRNLTAR
jgi:ABC-type glycerol-3-phosphate transport system permease component